MDGVVRRARGSARGRRRSATPCLAIAPDRSENGMLPLIRAEIAWEPVVFNPPFAVNDRPLPLPLASNVSLSD